MSVFENLPTSVIHFSKSLGTKVSRNNGGKLGKLVDYFIDYEEAFPQVLAIMFKHSGSTFYVDWKDIKSFSYKNIIIDDEAHVRKGNSYPKVTEKKIIKSILAKQYSDSTIDYPPLGKVVLDKQIVDTNGKKVVRVNDIAFIRMGKILRVTNAEVGLRSMVRRLGFEDSIDSIIRLLRPASPYLTNDTSISWKYVQAIPDKTLHQHVQISLNNEQLVKIHPADLADILEDLDSHGRSLIFKTLDPNIKAQTLSEIEQEIQQSIIEQEKPEDAAKIIENMDTDDAADLLNELDDDRADDIISRIEDDEIQEEILELREYDEQTAGGLMTTEIFQMSPGKTCQDAIDHLKSEWEEIGPYTEIYITDPDGILIGVCQLKKLLIQNSDVKIDDIMKSDDIKSIGPNESWKSVASFMSKYNFISIPVVDEESFELLGVVSVDDVLPWLLNER